MKYRPEIDGLRAVAVLPVILFHAGFDLFCGGYVGVDVFFVISGYLITCILIDELERDDFSFARFYERRARRILPALFVVMLACLPFAYFWMLPLQLKDFAQSLVAIVFFVSNVLFWREIGYFSDAANLKPLLHTWSLAVEEQYYLLFPILLLLLWRLGRHRVFGCLLVVAVLSFLLAEWSWRNAPNANFYLATTRAWELLFGSICAFFSVGRAQKSSNILSGAGLALIIYSVFAYDVNTPSPSLYTIIPVFGTTLIIMFASSETFVSKILSLRGFVYLGLISYSAYLWHQPLFAFARLRSLTEPSHSLMAALVAASLILAGATWYWVEQPFRRRTNPVFVTRRSVFIGSCAVGAVFALLGLAGHVANGFEWRVDGKALRYANAAADRAEQNDGCFFTTSLPPQPIRNCIFPNKNGEVDVILMGDSHALAISETLGEILRSKQIGYYDVSYGGCLPLPGLVRFDGLENSSTQFCSEFNDSVYNYALSAGVSTIVITARYPMYLLGTRYDNGEGGVEHGEPIWVDVSTRNKSVWKDDARQKRVIDAFERGIRKLAGKFNVVLVYPIPEAGWNVPNYLFKNAFFNGTEAQLSTSYYTYKDRTKDLIPLFDRLSNELPTVYGAPVQKKLCSEATGRCVNADNGGVYYFDDDHLSGVGARLVAPVIIEAIEAAVKKNIAARISD